MNRDGIDDFGLWVPDRNGQDPDELSEWYLLVSEAEFVGDPGIPVVLPSDLFDPFSTAPFGNDICAQFGDIDANLLLGNFDPPVSTSPATPEDFTGDGIVDAADIDQLFGAVVGNSQNLTYDLDNSGAVNKADVDYLIGDMLCSNYGDADLNQFDISDFNRLVVNFSPLADNLGWQHGDFDGDGDVDITDFGKLVRNFNPLGNATVSSAVSSRTLSAVPTGSSGAVSAEAAASNSSVTLSATAPQVYGGNEQPMDSSGTAMLAVDVLDPIVRGRNQSADDRIDDVEQAFADWG